jgi:hypothetical protein
VTCAATGKVRYPCQRKAVAALIRIGNKGLNSYPCHKCKGWHLGTSHNPLKVQARISQLLAR